MKNWNKYILWTDDTCTNSEIRPIYSEYKNERKTFLTMDGNLGSSRPKIRYKNRLSRYKKRRKNI